MIKDNQTHNQGLMARAFLALVALTMVIALGMVTSVSAQTAQTDQAKEQKSASEKATVGRGDQQVAIDAQTGKIRPPTPEEANALTEAMSKLYNRRTEALKATYLPNGTIMVELPDEFMEVMVIKLNPDGTRSVECVTGAKAAEEALKARKAAAPSAKTESGKTPQKANQDKSKWEVM